MTIVHRDGVKHKNADGLSRWALPNNPQNPAYDLELCERELPIMTIHISDLESSFWEGISESYSKDPNCSTLLEILGCNHKQQGLIDSLPETWKQSYQEGRFCLMDGLL